MRILDYTTDVRDLVKAALAAVDRLLPRFQESRPDPSTFLSNTAPDLIALLTEVYQLRRFARLGAPHIEDLGGFGTGLDDSDAPTIMSSAEGKERWDFRPWLAEKLQKAEGLVFDVCELCLRGRDESPTPNWRRLSRHENPATECVRLLEGTKTYLGVILQLLDSGELRIQQLTGDDELDEDG